MSDEARQGGQGWGSWTPYPLLLLSPKQILRAESGPGTFWLSQARPGKPSLPGTHTCAPARRSREKGKGGGGGGAGKDRGGERGWR